MSNPVLRPKSVSKSGGEGFLKGCSEVDGSCENPRENPHRNVLFFCKKIVGVGGENQWMVVRSLALAEGIKIIEYPKLEGARKDH